MIEALKSLLSHASRERRAGHNAEAERLYSEAAEQARAKDAVGRAEALVGSAQLKRERGDLSSASLYLAEAITLLRGLYAAQPEVTTPALATALRTSAEVRGELNENAVAGNHIQEAVQLYRAAVPDSKEDLARALRVAAMHHGREAAAAWHEAKALFHEAASVAEAEEAERYLECLEAVHQSPRKGDTNV